MLKRLFQLILSQILKIKSSLQLKDERPWGFKELFLSLGLFVLEAISALLKFVILVFKKPSDSYIILTNPAPEKLYEYSYLSHKRYQKRISVFSLTGVITIVAAVVLVSLVLNLLTGPALQTLGATYSWTQTSWTTLSSNYPEDPTNRTNWAEYSTSTNIYLANSGTDLQIATTTLSTTQTSAADFNAGTYTSNTEISGNSVILTSSGDAIAVSQISTVSNSSCAVAESGAIYCWGYNFAGNLGDDSTTARYTPVQVLKGEAVSGDTDGTYLTNIKSVSLGISTCAVSNSGNVYCWGHNGYGSVGDNTTTERHTPVRVHGVGNSGYLSDIAIVSAGGQNTCAVSNGGNVYCWGQNSAGQLGIGTEWVVGGCLDDEDYPYDCNTYASHYTPVEVKKGAAQAADNDGTYLSNAKEVDVGNIFLCAVSNGGNTYCWGSGAYGILGDNSTDSHDTPIQVLKGEAVAGDNDGTFLTNIKSVKATQNNYQNCAVSNGGNPYCWGYNSEGQLGDYSTTDRWTPVRVHGVGDSGYLNDITIVGTSYFTACALSNSGNGFCWGRNNTGQFGNNTKTGSTTPVEIHGVGDSGYLSNIKSLSSGAGHSCAVTTDNSAYCWGSGSSGQVGDNSDSERDTPVQVHGVGDSGYLSLSAGTTYDTPGTFTSGIIDIGYNVVSWGNISWTASGGQTVTMKTRSSANADMSGATDWTGNCDVTSGAALSTGGCVTDGHRYIQYQAEFSTANPSATPSLDDVTIDYVGYSDWSAMESSFYNTDDPTNVFAQLIWNEDESLPSGTEVKFQAQSAPDSSGTPGSSSGWMGSDGTSASYFSNTDDSCSKDGTTVTCTFPTDIAIRTGGEDQWIQYKIFMTSSGASTPTVSDITLKYVVNVTPDFQNVTAAQNSDGTVTINFDVRDTDTNTGTISSGNVVLSLQYFDGSIWQNAATFSAGSDTGLKSVNNNDPDPTTDYKSYSMIWDPKTDFNGQATTTMQVRVKANDQEAANNFGYGTASAFALDTKDPVSSSAVIDGRDDSLALSATDDNTFQMMLSNNSDYSADGANDDSGNWVAYAASRSWTPPISDPKTIYIKYKDAYNNVSETTVTVPATPENTFVQDISLAASSAYRIFFSWGVVASTTPSFSNYYVERSVSSTSGFANINTISDRLTNYYVDGTVNADTTYYYHVYQKDSSLNYSGYSTVISAIPNGTADGGEGPSASNDVVPPTISGISISSITTSGAKITWNTNELSDSYVRYDTTGTSYNNKQGVVSMVTSHEVTLVGLSSATTYIFLAESNDTAGNVGRDSSATNTFTTLAASSVPVAGGGGGTCPAVDTAAPQISDIKIIDIKFNEATVTWNTNENADSFIEFGTTDKYGSNVAEKDYGKSHKLTMKNLNSDTEYHFVIISTDKSGNQGKSTDKTFKTAKAKAGEAEAQNAFNILDQTLKSLNGDQATEQLREAIDNNANLFPVPVIIGDVPEVIIGASSATISWKTDKESNSMIALARADEYKADASEPYPTQVGNPAEQITVHKITIGNLMPATTYHYQLRSQGLFGNAGKSKDLTFTTKAEPPQISRFLQKKVSDTTATIYWNTNIPTDSLIQYTPVREGKTSEKETKIQGKPDFAVDHEITLVGLEPNITYNIEVAGRDILGNQTSKLLPPFTTTIDRETPIISLVKTESAIQPGFADKIQTIISWKTDEPSTSQVIYQEGLSQDKNLEKSTNLDSDLAVNHAVVITSFKSATVYSFRVKSIDEAGNETVSKDFTILTPQKAQSVIQVIINNFENTFGWFKKLQL